MAALIAYYSRAGENYFGGAYRRIAVGNTEKAANMLAELTGGELYKIEQEQPYSEEYNALLRELLGKNLGEGSTIAPPLSGAALDMLTSLISD